MELKVKSLTLRVKEAQRNAADADAFNLTTLGDLTQILEQEKSSWLRVVEYVRARTNRCVPPLRPPSLRRQVAQRHHVRAEPVPSDE